MPILEVQNLRTHFFTEGGIVRAVDGVSFDLSRGETVGLVGESGCGKSVLSLSLMRLVEPPGKIVSGKVLLGNLSGLPQNILDISKPDIRKIRGRRVSMVFQEPMTSLDPVYTIGDQIGEAYRAHYKCSNKEVMDRVIEMLRLVRIPVPERRFKNYPHELSGGMRQRAMIAMALVCGPDIVIADEPTTALDVTVEAGILDLISELQKEMGMAMLLVTHDLGVVAKMAKRVIVMYAGEFVETGTAEDIFYSPMHPYTQGLLKSIPKFGEKRFAKLATIPGTVPDLRELPRGCYFADRCPKALDCCRKERVPEDPCNKGRLVRCFYAG